MMPAGTHLPPSVSGSVVRRLNIHDGGQRRKVSASTAVVSGSVADGSVAGDKASARGSMVCSSARASHSFSSSARTAGA